MFNPEAWREEHYDKIERMNKGKVVITRETRDGMTWEYESHEQRYHRIAGSARIIRTVCR